MSSDDFGKDLGLVHQAILTGRKVGVERSFWACLAHNENLFKIVSGVVEQELVVSGIDKAAVKEWIVSVQESDHPYDEEKSYYSRSSHSHHSDKLRRLFKGAAEPLFWRAQFNENAAAICAEMEKCFQIAYAHSSLYWCCHYTEDATSRWFHHPSWGLLVTFNNLLENDYRVALGRYLKLEQFKVDESVREMAKIISEIKRDDIGSIKFFAERGEELLGRSRNALHAALDKLLGMVS